MQKNTANSENSVYFISHLFIKQYYWMVCCRRVGCNNSRVYNLKNQLMSTLVRDNNSKER